MVLAGALLAVTSTAAQADTITAVGQGWCREGECNNVTTGAAFNNTFAGSHFTDSGIIEFRNWFAFKIPAREAITAATLEIWNEAANRTEDPDAVYELRNASAISFDGLAGSTTLGSIGVSVADTGTSHFVSFPLTGVALDLLNAARGGNLLFGGVVTPFSPDREVQIFGYSVGAPVAFLDVSPESVTPVPEPSSMLLIGTGALALARKWRPHTRSRN
jgi:hypothetical protein